MRKKLIIVLVSLMLITQFIFQIYLARSDSQTTDEGVHISAGYTYLTKNDFRFNPEHPSLVKILAGLPLLFLNLNVPEDASFFDKAANFYYDSWQENRAYGDQFLYSIGNNPDLILFASRIPMALLTLLLGLAIFAVSSRLWGVGGGIFSLALYILEPVFFGHGHLVTTDIAASLGYLMSVFLFWILLRKPSFKNIVLFGIAFGFAQLVKFTSVILIPTIFILLIYFKFAYKVDFRTLTSRLGKVVLSLGISLIIIWAGYFFKIDQPPSLIANDIPEKNRVVVADLLDRTRSLLIPKDYFKGLAMVIGHTQYGHDSFLLGEKSKTGWWYYFPVIMLAKTSISLLVIILISLIFVFKKSKRRRKAVFFLIAALVYLGFAMLSKANLGVRHVMPVYVIFIVLSGISAKYFGLVKLGKALISVLIIWLIIENFMVFPNYLSYYNKFFGGTKNGYNVATDSNYDWGQDLKRIKAYLNEHPEISKPFVVYPWDSEGAIDYYKIDRAEYGGFTELPREGYLIIGASFLHNLPFDSLQGKRAYDRITPSVFVYKLNE